MSRRLLACLALVVAGVGGAPALAATHKRDPETDKSLGPQTGAGHYLGGQSSTSRWHGCTKEDTQWYPTSLQSGQPTTTPSTHRYVQFTVIAGSGRPTFSWRAKPGFTICGVEAFALLSNSTTRGGQYLTWVAYKSEPTSGSTPTSGRETVKVHTPKDLGSDQPELKIFAGKTLGIDAFQAISVYVKKR